jgi:uncharacterized protein (DUF934 family)
MPLPPPQHETRLAAAPRVRIGGPPDLAGSIWRDGTFHRDVWTRITDTEAVPDTPAAISTKRWLADRKRLVYHGAPLGLVLHAGQRVDDIAGDLAHFSLIALDFPKFSDGRAFSTARLLRDKHGYAGELRATGNVLSDQIHLMRRVGFDAFEVTHAATRRLLTEGRIAEITLHYQPAGTREMAAGTRAWLRRSTT